MAIKILIASINKTNEAMDLFKLAICLVQGDDGSCISPHHEAQSLRQHDPLNGGLFTGAPASPWTSLPSW